MTDVEIPNGSTWKHVASDLRCVVLGSNSQQVSIRYDEGGFDIVPRAAFLASFRPVDDGPPKPTPSEWWAVLASNSGGWLRYRRKAGAESVAARCGGCWIAPVVPDMDRAVWVPGVES